MPWRGKWQPAPIFLPGKSHGQRSLADWAIVFGVAKSQTQLIDYHTHTQGGSWPVTEDVRVCKPSSLPFGRQCWALTYTPAFPFGIMHILFSHKSLSQYLLPGTWPIILFHWFAKTLMSNIKCLHMHISIWRFFTLHSYVNLYTPGTKIACVNYSIFVRILNLC